MDTEQEIKQLSDRLGLAYERQDWGIINADPARVVEFIQVYDQGRHSDAERYALEELIIASMNEAMVEGVADENVHNLFDAFLRTHTKRAIPHIRYWGGLQDAQEFPIAATLRSFVMANQVPAE
jgi:hypothetical protein